MPGVTASDSCRSRASGGETCPARSRGILKRVSARPASLPRRQVEVVHPPNFIGRSRRQLERAEVLTSDWGNIHRPDKRLEEYVIRSGRQSADACARRLDGIVIPHESSSGFRGLEPATSTIAESFPSARTSWISLPRRSDCRSTLLLGERLVAVMKVIYTFVGSLLYLCAVVLFVFALIASLETNGLFLSEMFPTWLSSALIALALGLACVGAPWLGAQLKAGQGRPAAAPRA